MQNIFDTHAHYDDEKFAEDRHNIISTLKHSGIKFVLNASSSIKSSMRSMELAQKYSFIYASVGIHPHEAKSATINLENQLEEMAKQPKVMAIGEIGLDYHYDFSPREIQREVFRRQLAVAKKLDLPVIIHDREAHMETMDLLREFNPKGILHCYSGSVEMAQEIVKLGMYIGFTGVVTFKSAKKTLEVAKSIPLERLLVETDCPYMAPEPFRGKRCDSSMLDKTLLAIAECKGIDAQELADITMKNACEVFGIYPA